MSALAELIGHLGPRLVHVTAASAVPVIATHGLLSPHDAAIEAGHDPKILLLRHDRVRLPLSDGHEVVLNHQRPIIHAGDAPERVLDGHSRHSWAAQLDRRVFFWPTRAHSAFADSVNADHPTAHVTLDTAKVLEVLGERLDLCAINSGNFRQGGAHARRGDWIYIPAMAGLAAFRKARVNRGLVTSHDTVKEVSVRGSIPIDVLRACGWEEP